MKEETSMNVWKESFLIKVYFLTRNDDLRKVAGNWTTSCTEKIGPDAIICREKSSFRVAIQKLHVIKTTMGSVEPGSLKLVQ